MKTHNKVICFVGPSGVGKTSYAKQLVEKHNFALPAVATTRQKRSDDDGRYLYVVEPIFLEMISLGAFLEWDIYSNYYYGTLLQSVEDAMSAECHHGIVLDLTPNGYLKLKKAIPTAVAIALLPDNPIWLLERLKNRNSQSLEEINARMNLLKNYLDEIELLNCAVVYAGFSPDSWNKTFEEIEQIVFE